MKGKKTMTVLAENLKTIRKSLYCTQMAISEVLGIGFRTYVRYEAGERDAPVSVLIKMAKLGNIPLDRFLIHKVMPEDLNKSTAPSAKSEKVEVVSGSLTEGRLSFKGISQDFYITTNANEKKLLTHFRKLGSSSREKCIQDMEKKLKKMKTQNLTPGKKKVPKKVIKAQNTSQLKKMAKTIKKITLKG